MWIRSADSLEVELSDRVRRTDQESLMHLDHAFIEIETAVDNQVRIGAPELAEVATELMSALRPALERTMLGVIQEAAAEISAQLVGPERRSSTQRGRAEPRDHRGTQLSPRPAGGVRGQSHPAPPQLAQVARSKSRLARPAIR